MSENFTEIKLTKMDASKGTLRAMASCKVAGLIWLTGLRVIEGKNGLFVAMASRKLDSGEYKDIFFPADKAIREELQEAVLNKYYEEA